MAERDQRITAAALIGGSTAGAGDRWSDLDLGFGVAEGHEVAEVIADWTAVLGDELQAVHLFDLPYLSSVYRVFLLPGALQVDLSFTPAADFGALGPRFSLLFGQAVTRDLRPGPPPEHSFGLAVHHAVRGRICIERDRPWQAEHWISGVRAEALSLACRRLGLEHREGRGYDRLPAELLARAEPALVTSLDRDELQRALGAAIDLLLGEAGAAPEPAARLREQLLELAAPGALT